MHARRFSFVCLAAALLGAGFAIVVQQPSRHAMNWATPLAGDCPVILAPGCNSQRYY
ncbi:hypothetical protein [Oricola cellulosilytica]|uniref:hypothetical protein n=1 Tax=Oricola cellulosilytica TaxID=1429082 RepID=UPI00130498A5|nr:hypothetical protein [Oricola cellulosilytica]